MAPNLFQQPRIYHKMVLKQFFPSVLSTYGFIYNIEILSQKYLYITAYQAMIIEIYSSWSSTVPLRIAL